MIYFIDIFCGAGGTTEAAEGANIDVIACINHDANAIKSHETNHPNCLHFLEDVRVLAMYRLKLLVQDIMRRDPEAKFWLWASLECTNHSRAKGGLPRNQDSRTLAIALFRYVDALLYIGAELEVVWIENVIEFLIWGPLDNEGKPIPEHKGIDFKAWKDSLCRKGFNYEHRILSSDDFGAFTKRKRYFAQFSKWGTRAVWPEATHGKDLIPYNPVKEVLDLDVFGASIFDRKKLLVGKSIQRILRGLKKFHGSPQFLAKYYSQGANVESIDKPCATVTTKDRFQFVSAQYGNPTSTSIESPCGTITANPKQILITAFLLNPQFNSKGASINHPCFTLIARMDKAPPYLIHVLNGEPVQRELPDDYADLIDFMIENNIRNIFMRMLSVQELLRIQGFPEDYHLKGTQADQKKFIGNSVEVNCCRELLKARLNKEEAREKAA